MDFSAFDGTLLAWLSSRNTRPAASYVNWLGRTVTQVREEAALHQLLKKALLALPVTSADDPGQVHRSLQDAVKTGSITLSQPAPTPLHWRIRNLLHKLGVPLVALLLTPLILVMLPFYALALRLRERADAEVLLRPDPALVGRLAALEDHMVTNQFTAFDDVKPGRFRLYTIATLLYLLNYAAVHIFNRGYLTRVQTIHFAHWIFLDDRQRVLFLSNYDGSHEGYMDDFINKVAWGLNLVFSNGVGYPRSRWLIKGGAE